ncbi:siderophore-interacting protein [uncultured Chitinophaga sp.]|jgi:Siderophore-interacting protein|uniref:siderophore-interacting protein n=1 Tax=uncultured Chitinophaga sp. TaxID=339340 RepID=UPI00260D312F|nr:siderophore-interacting protein [uncultured Chitinophaga sp.]
MGATLQLIKRKAISLIEQRMSKTGTVLAVRAWQPDAVMEVDLHLPGVNMHKWTQAQHIKCKVADFEYRDYTPCGWDAETATCTLIIHTGHDGAGARWARNLQSGDIISYVGIGSSMQKPADNVHLVFLGDESAIGHFVALHQLAKRPLSVTGAIAFSEPAHQDAFREYFCDFGTVQAVVKTPGHDSNALLQWVAGHHFYSNTVFYLVGQIPVVVQLRNLLKAQGISGIQIKSQGFWK